MIYKDYLLEELNKTKAELGFNNYEIVVTEERSFKLPKTKNTKDVILFLIKKLTGNYVLNIKTQPIQIICYSELNSFNVAQQILDLFILNHKNGSPDSTFYEGNVLIKQNYDTAVTLRAFVPTDIGFKASLYCYGNYVECTGLSDISNIKYNTGGSTFKDINYINASLVYAAITNSNKDSGEEISISLKQEAGFTISMTLMNDNSVFVRTINRIMLGEEIGNKKLLLSFTLNNVNYQEEFILKDATFSTDRINAPALQITLTR